MNPDRLYFRRLRFWLVWLALIVLTHSLVLPGQAQETQETESAAAVETPKADDEVLRLSGTVINALSGEPIRRAAVQIVGAANLATLTDNSGNFEFDGLSKGSVSIAATKPGFFSEQGTASGFVPLQVAAGAAPVVLKMIPGGIIFGRVTARDAQPLENLQVHLVTRLSMAGRKVWFDRQYQARTDENGEFRISNLPAGTYHVAVDQSQETTLAHAGVANAREQIYTKVFYPGVSEFNASSALELRAGQQLEANFSLTAEPVYQISGTVSTQENVPSSLTFTRKAGDGDDFVQVVSAQDGKLQGKLPAGSYSVNGFSATGSMLSTQGGPVVISSDSADVHVALTPAASIAVIMRTEVSGGASGQGGGEADPNLAGVSLQLVSSTAFFNRSNSWWRPTSGSIQNVEPGEYAVEVNTPGPWCVKSIHSGSVDLISDELTIAAGSQPLPIEVTLRDDAGSVTGTIAAAPTDRATVLLVQQRGRRNLIKMAFAMEGKFLFQGVTPGDYVLIALGDADKLEYEDPEVLNPYLSNATHVSVQPRGTANVSLNLSPVGR